MVGGIRSGRLTIHQAIPGFGIHLKGLASLVLQNPVVKVLSTQITYAYGAIPNDG